MPRFTILPIDSSHTPVHVDGVDAATVLNTVSNMPFNEAHVLQDGKYTFSIRTTEGGAWIVFQRDESPVTAAHDEVG